MRITMTISILAAGCLWGTAALGQYAAGDGRDLEANTQVGSGGLNHPVQQPNDGSLGNAIVTGNVSGLGAFHGDVGYSAPGEFLGDTGSDDLYRFRRQSFPTYDPNRFGGRANAGGPVVIQRPGAGVSSGDFTTSRGFSTRVQPVRDDASSSAVVAATSSSLRRDQEVFQIQALPMGAYNLGGTAYLYENSPLTGFTRLDLAAAEQRHRERSMGQYLRFDPTALDGVTAEPREEAMDLTEAQYLKDRAMLPLSLTVAAAMVEPLDGRAAGTGDEEQEAARALGQMMFLGLAEIKARPGEDSYVDLLNRIRGQPEKTWAETSTAGTAPPTDTAALTEQLGEALDDPLGASGDPLVPLVPLVEPPVLPEVAAVAKEVAARRAQRPIDKLLSRIDYDLPPLSTLKSTAGSKFNSILADAEDQMSHGQYFKAIDEYSRSLVLKPNHPMGMIGQMHAELGAGLWTSAAFHLRHLLTRYPELIAARYTFPVLPGEDRLKTIEQRLLSRGDRADDADGPLLLAYVAYQQSRPAALDSALDDFERAGGDEQGLLALLRRIWQRQ
ncbi:MAG: hypothetical protein CMJ49_01525 [Planctomycetaceae bacterium]|nr:hypothetical protein [Planctomycetaceae bacterium]